MTDVLRKVMVKRISMQKNKVIAILGHKGMLGRAIWEKAVEQGYTNLVGADLPELNLCDQRDVQDFFERERPEYVFFLAAAAAGIAYKKAHPADILVKNLQMITNVMDSANANGCSKMLNICSALVYPQKAEIPFKEVDATYAEMNLVDTPYALAKACGMQLAKYYNSQYGRNYITAVPCNFFGPFAPFEGDRAGVVPSLIARISRAKNRNDKAVEVWGTGNACRDLLGVSDVADACLFMMERDCAYDIFNIGSGFEYRIAEVAEVIKKVVRYEGQLMFNADRPEGRQHMMMESSRLFSMGWKPKNNLEESIRITYEWYRKNRMESNE